MLNKNSPKWWSWFERFAKKNPYDNYPQNVAQYRNGVMFGTCTECGADLHVCFLEANDLLYFCENERCGFEVTITHERIESE